MKKIIILLLLLISIISVKSQDLRDSKQIIIENLEAKSNWFKSPKLITDNRFEKNIIMVDNLLHLQLETSKIKYLRCERKDYDITYNYILDTNDICVSIILEIEASDILDNIITCKESEDGVKSVGDNKWIQIINSRTIYYKLINAKYCWLFIKW